jgi:SAM-dependent methyltransferase
MSGTTAVDKDRSELDLLLRGFQVSRMLRVVADLGLADRLAPDAAVVIADLASACNVNPTPLLRILRALAAFGVFRVSPDGVVSHSPRSRLLRTDTPNSLHHAARFWTTPGSWAAWGMLDAALTGGNPHQAAWDMSRFDYLRRHGDEARIFDRFMANFPDNRHAAVAASYDFSSARLIVDIAGGNGEALRHILGTCPGPRGLVFDRPDVVHAIPAALRLQGRIDAEGGDFFDKIPPGADCYLMMRVLHNWSDDDCSRILRNCRAAITKDARLLIVDHILEPDPARGKAADYLLDTQMMAMFGEARERTESEFRDLLTAAGFVVRRVIPTPSPVSIIEAGPV